MSGHVLPSDMIRVTPAAHDYFRSILGDASGVRLSIKAGKGCGGNEYLLDLVHGASSEDDRLELDGWCLYVPPFDLLKLVGATVDYRADSVGNARVHIDNPNESGRCGCGQSVNF